ncbi:hypothetical protein CRM22_001722, partial [Opisthorchis felineus]
MKQICDVCAWGFLILVTFLLRGEAAMNCAKFINHLMQEFPVDYPEDRYYLRCTDKRCLLHVFLEKDFFSAKRICTQLTAELWIPRPGERIGYDMWIGIVGIQMNKDDMELAWGTANLEVLNEENWAALEPHHHANATCAIAKVSEKGRWVTQNCKRQFFFTCSFDLNPKPIN